MVEVGGGAVLPPGLMGVICLVHVGEREGDCVEEASRGPGRLWRDQLGARQACLETWDNVNLAGLAAKDGKTRDGWADAKNGAMPKTEPPSRCSRLSRDSWGSRGRWQMWGRSASHGCSAMPASTCLPGPTHSINMRCRAQSPHFIFCCTPVRRRASPPSSAIFPRRACCCCCCDKHPSQVS